MAPLLLTEYQHSNAILRERGVVKRMCSQKCVFAGEGGPGRETRKAFPGPPL
jgi:hypothetical protein